MSSESVHLFSHLADRQTHKCQQKTKPVKRNDVNWTSEYVTVMDEDCYDAGLNLRCQQGRATNSTSINWISYCSINRPSCLTTIKYSQQLNPFRGAFLSLTRKELFGHVKSASWFNLETCASAQVTAKAFRDLQIETACASVRPYSGAVRIPSSRSHTHTPRAKISTNQSTGESFVWHRSEQVFTDKWTAAVNPVMTNNFI